MKKKLFKTYVRAGHKLSRNDYVMGRLSGIKYVICNGDPNCGFAHNYMSDGSRCFYVECTAEQYRRFAEVVEEIYPGLCVFDLEGVL